MFLDILKREDVHNFLLEITIDETRFSKKEIPYMICEEKISVTEYNLFTLLDALFKYSIIIDDLTYFDEFLKDVHKILKKVQNHNDVQIGISRVLINACKKILGIKNIDSYEDKLSIVSYIYDRYIVHGFLFHSFPAIYLNQVEENGIVNVSSDSSLLDSILDKYTKEKLTSSSSISITDSPFMAFYYAYHTPYFMGEIVNKGDFVIDSFFRKDYPECVKRLSSISRKYDMFAIDKNQLIGKYNELWDYYNLDDSFPVVASIKRSDYGKNSLREYSQLCEKLKEKDIVSIVTCIFDTRLNQDHLEENVSPLSIRILMLPNLTDLKIPRVRKKDQILNGRGENGVVDQYGNVTIIALVGVLFIALGFIVAFVMIGGMS